MPEVAAFQYSVNIRQGDYEERYRQRVLRQLSQHAQKLVLKLVATEQFA